MRTIDMHTITRVHVYKEMSCIFLACAFSIFFPQPYEYSRTLRALSNGKQFARVWLQKPGLTQENRFGAQSSKQFHTFLPD